jgi:hypothetical protein
VGDADDGNPLEGQEVVDLLERGHGNLVCELSPESAVQAALREGLDGPIVGRHKYAGHHPLD